MRSLQKLRYFINTYTNMSRKCVRRNFWSFESLETILKRESKATVIQFGIILGMFLFINELYQIFDFVWH
jgi:hypothetical protein